MYYSVVLPCGGKGKRMELDYNKLFCYIGKHMVIEKAVKVFQEDERCRQIVIVHSKEDEEQIKKVCKCDKCYFTIGGSERFESVYQGLQIVSEPYVLVHDGARPFITREVVDRVLDELEHYPAVICGVGVKDTIKRVVNGEIVDTPDRSELWQAQTPQGFNTNLLLDCYEHAVRNNIMITDDAAAVEKFGKIRVRMVMGDYANKKITTKEDL